MPLILVRGIPLVRPGRKLVLALLLALLATVALKLLEGTCLLLGRWAGANYRVEMIDTSRLGWFAHYEFIPMDME
ncbi:MAG TPA: hypothetical protein VFS67_06450 [Polyangiaceae bacterium]|nr:hypothetical protein [Polyangiaceae bacterium]